MLRSEGDAVRASITPRRTHEHEYHHVFLLHTKKDYLHHLTQDVLYRGKRLNGLKWT
ncbi:unnamed protein product [Acanthoscelides obtectus]|uniref:Uncharacterized protein n=1 Tax=Acanthoscelides obtectus TaxID=200917 RepID=A0A9P0QGT7_ACAOB|nr:unnamed protein product [Acanthoscelides obtectus]CAK1682505.1 hypothetical protein AOBTE_LOCUS33681 [Acanthoscelides obtectus]